VDYIFQRKCLRYPTGITGIPNNKKYFNKGKLNYLVDDYQELNLHINSLVSSVENIIQNYIFKHKSNPTVQFVRDKIELQGKTTTERFEHLSDYFKQFLEAKAKDPIVPATLKDYKSTFNAISLYEHHYGALTIDKINSPVFLKEFEKFLSASVNEQDQEKFKVRGELNNNTIIKRIGCMRTFLFWLESKELLTLVPGVRKYKSALHKYDPVNVTLSIDELRALKALDLKGEEEFLRDAFIFLCMTGVRYSDLLSLTEHNINDDNVIVKDAQKTFGTFRVKMNEDAQRIYQKYKDELNSLSTTQFNKAIKELLKKYKLLSDSVRLIEIHHNQRTYPIVPRWSKVGTHTGRRTFINLMVENNVDINTLMNMTGHAKIDMLIKYFDRNRKAGNITDKINL